MHRLAVLPFVALLIAGCVDARDQEPDTTATTYQPIVGGTIDTGDRNVPIVSIGGGLCTGLVISPHVVLTAAHCLPGSPGNVELRFENQYGDGIGPVIDAVAISSNPQGADMGLIAMAEESPFPPTPINRADLTAHIGEMTRIVGFGVTSENGSDSGVKRQGTATLQDATLDEGGLIWTTNDPQGTCYGDSGGPNFMIIGGIEVVVGVTTTGTSICGDGLDIGSRVDTLADPWILNFINTHDGAAATCDADGRCATDCENPDPDCPCEDDGLCTDACPVLDDDPDCDNCVEDGVCQPGCPGTPDPDCGPPDGGPGADGDGGGGCCSAGGETPASAAIMALLAVLVLRRRRT